MPLPAWSIAVTEWTPARVEERLRKAVALKARLSGEAPVGEARDEPPFDGGRLGFERNDEVVAHAADALSWLRWLDPDDARIVVARLEGARWKLICWRFGISRPTADRRWRYALAVIAWRLNGHARTDRTPSLRSLLGLRRAA
jgi:hypothetical protein